jgi:lysozyme family protein
MANFDTAIITVLKHEGGYVDDPHDVGGATNFGISQRFLDTIKGYNGIILVKDLTQNDAIQIYHTHWWDKCSYDKINSQSVATKVFDLAINMGAYMAHTAIQRAVRAASGLVLDGDGKLGQHSIDAINQCNQDILLAALKSEAAGYYRRINNPHEQDGWLNRAYS